MWGELALSIKNGNIYMIAIILLSFISTTVIFERLIMLQFVYNIDFSKFLNNFRKMITSEDHERAINLCKSASKTSLPKIALRALEAVENDPSSVRGTIEEDTIEFLPRIESRLNMMPAMATIILLIGILGTIDALWWSFHSIDVLDTAKKQASLANGIAGSLNPTATAIIASMLVLASHQILKGMAIRIIDRIHHGIAVLNNLLVPEEVATVLAAPVSAAAEPRETSDAIVEPAGDPTPDQDEGMPADDAFDDAVVDDIKDEEEII
ncbi:MAG: MotA/TolQ/ExbB proton channel family protein [Oligoflexales bacterium]|nr:MotA/TolQ/ExbB proton channel family protein [Oligoflexales bacterium]